MPPLNFGGTPAGIDARLVADSGCCRSSTPVSRTGRPGSGRSGRHHDRADGSASNDAIAALAERTGRRQLSTAIVASAATRWSPTPSTIPSRSSTRRSAGRCRRSSTWSSRAGNSLSPSSSGPQVEFRPAPLRALAEAEVDPFPSTYAVARHQGTIIYMFVKARNELIPGSPASGSGGRPTRW